MITAFTAFLFNILANLSRRILKAELSNLTQRISESAHEEYALKSEIRKLTDENSKLIKAGLELSASYKELEGRLARETAAAVDLGRGRYKLIEQNTELTKEIARLTQALSDSGNDNRTLTSQLKETKAKLDTALMEAYGLQSQRRQDISTISRMEQDITKLTQAFSDLGTDRDRLSRCIKDITDALKFHQKQTQAGSQAPQPITDWRLNTFGADSGTTETPMNSTQKVT